MPQNLVQVLIFLLITCCYWLLTYLKCRGHSRISSGQNKEYFFAGGGLTVFVAGSITLTN